MEDRRSKRQLTKGFMGFTALIMLGLFLIGCSNLFGSGDKNKDEVSGITTKVLAGIAGQAVIYLDLGNPDTPLADPDNQTWEIMILDQREILTNSGVTAQEKGSGGLGGVVFSGSTNLSTEITQAQAKQLFADAAASSGINKGVDFGYYSKLRTTSTNPTSTRSGNALSFPGFKDQEGRNGETAGTAWVFGDPGAHVDVDFRAGTAYADWEMMTPSFSNFSGNVYVIRSGDGEKFYKFQVSDVLYQGPSPGPRTYTFEVKFAEIN